MALSTPSEPQRHEEVGLIGSPSYCTDLAAEELPSALASVGVARLLKRRDLAIEAIQE
jgi:hypothetical protein